MWYKDNVDPKNGLGMQRFSHLVMPTKYHRLASVTILILVGWVLSYYYY